MLPKILPVLFPLQISPRHACQDDVLVRDAILIVAVRRECLLKLFGEVGHLTLASVCLDIFYLVDLLVNVISVLLHAEGLLFLLNGREHVSHLYLHALFVNNFLFYIN